MLVTVTCMFEHVMEIMTLFGEMFSYHPDSEGVKKAAIHKAITVDFI